MSNDILKNTEWITINEAAKVARVCRRTIINWMEQDLLEVRRLPSGRRRIKESSLWRTNDGKNDRSS